MRKSLFAFVAVALMAAFTGCSSINVADKAMLNNQKLVGGSTVAHLHADVWGLYLFMIPIITGSSQNVGEVVFFKDTVKVSEALKMVTAKSKALGADETLDVVTTTTPMPFFWGMRSVTVSANLVK